MNNLKKVLKENSVPIIILIFTLILLICIGSNYINNIRQAKREIPVSKMDYIEEVVEEGNIEGLEQNEVKENVIKNQIKTATTTTEKKNTIPYYLKVNYNAQVVTVYGLDEEGKYTKPLKAIICSTGSATPKSGVYKIPRKYRWLRLIGDVWGQYSTQITGNILFHSVPYKTKDPSTLISNYYDKLGTYASAGCVRLTTADALWIYNNCPKGTQVEFYSSSDPGPLGKPSARKISGESEPYKNWDPTDPDPENPWKNYKQKNENIIEEQNIVNTIQNSIVTNEIQNTIDNNIIVNEMQNTILNNIISNETQNIITNNATQNNTNIIVNNISNDLIVNET